VTCRKERDDRVPAQAASFLPVGRVGVIGHLKVG
jgi:hypothetical protein